MSYTAIQTGFITSRMGCMTGRLTAPPPQGDDDVATKNYVDDNSGGGGSVTPGDQTFTGVKTFEDGIKLHTDAPGAVPAALTYFE